MGNGKSCTGVGSVVDTHEFLKPPKEANARFQTLSKECRVLHEVQTPLRAERRYQIARSVPTSWGSVRLPDLDVDDKNLGVVVNALFSCDIGLERAMAIEMIGAYIQNSGYFG